MVHFVYSGMSGADIACNPLQARAGPQAAVPQRAGHQAQCEPALRDHRCIGSSVQVRPWPTVCALAPVSTRYVDGAAPLRMAF